MRIDFIGIGGAKCGSTWIAKCLREHPEVGMSETKELNYFSRTRAFNTKSEYDARGINGYYELFKKCTGKKKIGEYSTHYLPDSNVVKIIKKHFPNVKLIVSLRHPVERAYSEYLINRYFILNEKDDFETAFLKRHKSYYDNYMDKGFYYKQLKPYFDNFPKRNIKVVIFEDVKKDAKKFIQEIYKFIEVDDKFIPESLNEKANPFSTTRFPLIVRTMEKGSGFIHFIESIGLGKLTSFIKRKTNLDKIYWKLYEKNRKDIKKPRLEPELKKRLMKVYLKDIKKLEKLIGKNIPQWKNE